MWAALAVCVLLGFSQASGEIGEKSGNRGSVRGHEVNEKNDAKNLTESFFEDVWDMTTALVGIGRSDERTAASSSVAESLVEGRGLKLKQKRAQLQFFMKIFLTLKVIFGLVLPLGIMASTFLAWKAVTLSLIALILSKINFFKNFLGTATLSAPSPQFIPPVFIHGLQNDPFWKRQTEAHPTYA